MKATTLILFAVITTTVLTTLFSQHRVVSTAQKRILRMLAVIGVVVLGAVTLLWLVRA